MRVILKSTKEKCVPLFTLTDYPKLFTLNATAAVYDIMRNAWDSAKADDVYMYQFYSKLNRLELCINVDVDIEVVIIGNYNGYTPFIQEIGGDVKGVISLDEYFSWKENNKAKWDAEKRAWYYEAV